MAWFKVDDGLHASRKLLKIPKRARFAAVGLWTIAGSWCADQLTDGVVPDYMLEAWGAPPSAPQSLVDAELWDRESGGYVFRNWHEYQPSKQDVDAERAASRERMKELRAKRKGKKPLEQAENPEVFGRTHPNGSENVRNPDPTRPDPTRPTYEGVKREGQAGTRIPTDFKLTPEMIRWAQDNAPNVNARASTQKFRAHYKAAAGPAQFKTDWTSAWEAWLLGDQERAAAQPQQFKTGTEKRMEQAARNHDLFAQIDAEREAAAKEITA
ncbi:replication initiation protein [Arthrobacter phage Shoya]|uniref:Uncharacterized protein n=1 Tax=Arthrobacter phage Shoya TaxID=2704035 RepID=A0A6G6XHZ6_9CAUD|nr:replication initiation protein [Arthrobacter phage Shoya]QIG57731.1 hypothetical protein SEA_SHOYA_60 [Arthrobacter phage Shoya]